MSEGLGGEEEVGLNPLADVIVVGAILYQFLGCALGVPFRCVYDREVLFLEENVLWPFHLL